MKRRLISAAAAALTTAGILALPSVAQEPPTEPITTFKVKSSVVPNKAGTPRNPQGVKIKASVSVTTTEGFEKPIFQSGYALFPRSGNWNGGKWNYGHGQWNGGKWHGQPRWKAKRSCDPIVRWRMVGPHWHKRWDRVIVGWDCDRHQKHWKKHW